MYPPNLKAIWSKQRVYPQVTPLIWSSKRQSFYRISQVKFGCYNTVTVGIGLCRWLETVIIGLIQLNYYCNRHIELSLATCKVAITALLPPVFQDNCSDKDSY